MKSIQQKHVTDHRATYRYKPQRAILIIAFQKISQLVFRFFWKGSVSSNCFIIISYFSRFVNRFFFVYCGANFAVFNPFLRPWQTRISKLQYNTGGRRKSPWAGSWLPCSQRLSTTWLDHAVSVLHDHIFWSAAFGLTTSCFFSARFLLAAATAVLMGWPQFRVTTCAF